MTFSAKKQEGNASLAVILGMGMLLTLFTANENEATHLLQSQVQAENVAALARDTNESTLLRTKSLLIPNSSGTAALAVNAGGFQKVSGTGFEVSGGLLNLETLQVQPTDFENPNAFGPPASAPKIATLLKVENALADPSGQVTAAVVSASTTVKLGTISKTIKTKAYFNLSAVNTPIPPLSPPLPVPPTPPAAPASTAAPAPPVAAANPSTKPVGCSTANAPPISVGDENGLGFGVSNGGVGFGSCGGIGFYAPPGFIGFCTPDGGSCFGIGPNGISLG